MKSFAKVSLLFALIIVGRYLQPTAPAALATRPAPAAQVLPLPLALARYNTSPKPKPSHPVQDEQLSNGYFL